MNDRLRRAAHNAPKVVAVPGTGEIVTEPEDVTPEQALMDRRPVVIVAKALTRRGDRRQDTAETQDALGRLYREIVDTP